MFVDDIIFLIIMLYFLFIYFFKYIYIDRFDLNCFLNYKMKNNNHHLRFVVLLVDVCGCVELLLLLVVVVLVLLLVVLVLVLLLDCDELLLLFIDDDDDDGIFTVGLIGVVGEPFVLLLLVDDDDDCVAADELANLNKLPTESSFLGGNLSFTLSRLFASSNDIFFLSTSVSLPKITLAVCFCMID